MKKLFIRVVLDALYFSFIVTLKNKNQKINDYFAKKFVQINNEYVIKNLGIKCDNVLILLPHCLQHYDCKYRITNDISNCISCGKCVIKYLVDINTKSNFHVKVASGGTIARKFIRDIKPNLVVAVACKRDLILGIKECKKISVYGIFNIIKKESCINTDVDLREIKTILEKLV